MKRWICLLLVLALSAMMLPVATAETVTQLPLVASGEGDARWVDGTNLILREGENAYYIAQMDGTPVSEEVFGRTFTYDEDGLLVTCAKLSDDGINGVGALDLEGKERIPFKYGDIDVLDEYWAVAVVLSEATADNYDYRSMFSDGYYLIQSVDLYYLPTNACVATLTRDQFAEAREHGHAIYVQDRAGVISAYDKDFNLLGTVDELYDEDYAIPDYIIYREDGKYGFTDAAGNVIVPPTYDYFGTSEGDYIQVELDDRYGLIDFTGKVLVPPEYDSIRRNYYATAVGRTYSCGGYYCVVKDDKIGYVAEGGEVTCEPKYAKDALDLNGASGTYTDIAGETHLIAADGAECTIEGYDHVLPLKYGDGFFYQVSGRETGSGLMDWHGNLVLPCQYERVELSGDGQYVLVKPSYNTYEIYQTSWPVPVEEVAPVAEPVAPVEAVAPAEAAAPAEEAAPAEASNSGAVALLDSALLLLNQDAAANGAAAAQLLSAALAQMDASSAAAGTISSAVTLLEADAGANGAAVVTLLESAKAQLAG